MRKHPIDGYNKMHKGTDFAAPMGTPIMASGDGVVKKLVGVVAVETVLSSNTTQLIKLFMHICQNLQRDQKWCKSKQAQIIGYVGSTGKSTGPHLHYEVIVNGKKINSQKLKLPSGKILKEKKEKSLKLLKLNQMF